MLIKEDLNSNYSKRIVMGELRKDYFIERYVLYAGSRGKRPHDFRQGKERIKKGICYFCPGNEKLTPKEIGRVEEDGRWTLRWFNNKFAAVEDKGSFRLEKGFLKKGNNYGKHEIIVESNNHNKQLWDLDIEHLRLLLEVYVERTELLMEDSRIKYVEIFKNHGSDAGTSLAHSHSQVVALPYVPPLIAEELRYSGKECGFCKIIKAESKSRRKAFENNSFVAVAPYASRFSFELWILAKRHTATIAKLNNEELYDLAEMLFKALKRLKELNAPYNMYLHQSPKGKKLHFHIEITPRLSKLAGFELATGSYINPVLPEKAAGFYRD